MNEITQKELDKMMERRDDIWDHVSKCILAEGTQKTTILGELVELEHELEQLSNQ